MPLTFPIVLVLVVVLVLEFQSVTEALKLPRYPPPATRTASL
jgi:hypothetical protein